MIVLQGRLDSIRFSNEENGYTVARFTPDGYQTEITVVGILAGVRPGETLRIEGDWEKHIKFGEQFRIAKMEVILPDTARGIKRYLASGVISGVGEVMAEKLVAYFGSHTLEVLDASPERLCEVPGIGKSKAKAIADSWKSYHAIRTLMALMAKSGPPPLPAQKFCIPMEENPSLLYGKTLTASAGKFPKFPLRWLTAWGLRRVFQGILHQESAQVFCMCWKRPDIPAMFFYRKRIFWQEP